MHTLTSKNRLNKVCVQFKSLGQKSNLFCARDTFSATYWDGYFYAYGTRFSVSVLPVLPVLPVLQSCTIPGIVSERHRVLKVSCDPGQAPMILPWHGRFPSCWSRPGASQDVSGETWQEAMTEARTSLLQKLFPSKIWISSSQVFTGSVLTFCVIWWFGNMKPGRNRVTTEGQGQCGWWGVASSHLLS